MKNKENISEIYSFKPRSIIVYTNHLGKEYQYTILSVKYGAENCESFIEVESTFNPTIPLYFPMALLNAALSSGQCKIYD